MCDEHAAWTDDWLAARVVRVVWGEHKVCVELRIADHAHAAKQPRLRGRALALMEVDVVRVVLGLQAARKGPWRRRTHGFGTGCNAVSCLSDRIGQAPLP